MRLVFGRTWTRAWVLIALIATLAGCAELPASSSSGVVAVWRNDIDLQGRLSVRYQVNGKDEALHGNFEWHQRGEQIDISLRSPLGQTLAQIVVGNGSAQLTQPGQSVKVATDVDTLVAQTLGWPLPIAGLRQWLQGQGQRSDGSRFVASKEMDNITTHDGWRLRYVNWHDDGRPRRIDLERHTVEAGEVGLRLVIDATQ